MRVKKKLIAVFFFNVATRKTHAGIDWAQLVTPAIDLAAENIELFVARN